MKSIANKVTMMNSRSLATASKVPMSLLEKDKYINYEKMESNLKIVRDR